MMRRIYLRLSIQVKSACEVVAVSVVAKTKTKMQIQALNPFDIVLFEDVCALYAGRYVLESAAPEL